MSTFNRTHLIRQVDLFTLRLFLSAVEEEQIGLAAIRENVAASTATKRIQELEEIAGLPLLERGPKGVTPSPAGAVLTRYARDIFDSLEDLRAEIAAFTEGVRGVVTIAAPRSVIVPFLARELGEYSREYPLVSLRVQETGNPGVAQAVARGDADVGAFVASHTLDLSGLDVVPYRRDRMIAVLPLGHRLQKRQSVTFGELLEENLIAVSAMLDAFGAAAKRIGATYEPLHEVVSPEVALSLVRAGLGVTVQPECLLDLQTLGKVVTIPLDEPWAERRIHLATPRGRALTPAAGALVKTLLGGPREGSEDSPGAQ